LIVGCVVDHWFVLLCFSFAHCIVCPSIYSVRPLWYCKSPREHPVLYSVVYIRFTLNSFFPGFVKYGSIVAKDWYLFTCCFYTYHVIKKDISFCFFFLFSKFEIVRQINAFGKPDLFF
jgi:hypothetical protein